MYTLPCVCLCECVCVSLRPFDESPPFFKLWGLLLKETLDVREAIWRWCLLVMCSVGLCTVCHPICIYLKCVLYFCNINSLYPGVFLGVCVCLVTEADSANVTQVSGTHSSDYCAIPPSFRLSLISLPSCIPPSFPSSLLLFCSLLSSLHLSFPFLFIALPSLFLLHSSS